MTTLEQAARMAHLWECIGRWSAYLVTNGEQAELSPPDWLIDAVKAATEPPKQEPVAWATMPEADDWCFVSGSKDPNKKLEGVWVPLYTEPPKREWVGLTDEEIENLCWTEMDRRLLSFARAIEAALKEKNG